MTNIISNGSKWAGESPDDIETLCRVLQSHTLNRMFEDYANGTFATSSHWSKTVRFFGNFIDVSHVFSIDTDEPAIIDRLTTLIRANQQKPEYQKQPSPAQCKQAEDEYNAALNAKRIAARKSRRDAEALADEQMMNGGY